MSRFYKEDTLHVRINPILKTKFHIAVWFAWISATINSFINDYVRDYEKQYWVIPISLTNSIKYDVLTKFFWIKIDKKLYQNLSHEETLNLINDKLWTNMNIEDLESMIQKYPKTRKDNVNKEYISCKDFV